MSTLLHLFVLWFAVSIPSSLIIGKFLARRTAAYPAVYDPELELYTADLSYAPAPIPNVLTPQPSTR